MTPVIAAHADRPRKVKPAKTQAHETAEVTVAMIDVAITDPHPHSVVTYFSVLFEIIL